MKSGDFLVVEGIEVRLWSRAPHTIAGHLYDPWWVVRAGPNGRQEMWAIGKERRHGRFTRNWRFVGRFTWQGERVS